MSRLEVKVLHQCVEALDRLHSCFPRCPWRYMPAPAARPNRQNYDGLRFCATPHDTGSNHLRLFDWDRWRVDVGTDDLAYMMALHWVPDHRRRNERLLLDEGSASYSPNISVRPRVGRALAERPLRGRDRDFNLYELACCPVRPARSP